jgi:hypothetical protein
MSSSPEPSGELVSTLSSTFAQALSQDNRVQMEINNVIERKIHSKRVGKKGNYTRNEWGRRETTLKTSGEDLKLHSQRVRKMFVSGIKLQIGVENYVLACLCIYKEESQSIQVINLLHWFRVYFLDLLHSFRVFFKVRQIAGLQLKTFSPVIVKLRVQSSPLISSVVIRLLHSFRV